MWRERKRERERRVWFWEVEVRDNEMQWTRQQKWFGLRPNIMWCGEIQTVINIEDFGTEVRWCVRFSTWQLFIGRGGKLCQQNSRDSCLRHSLLYQLLLETQIWLLNSQHWQGKKYVTNWDSKNIYLFIYKHK